MKIIFAGGGTAGHINPALAIASYVRKLDPSAEILYVGAVGGMEENLVKKAGFDFHGIEISGFSRKLSLDGFKKNMLTLRRIITASTESKKILDKIKPDICVGTGGYVSGPILRVAAKMKIPIIIHEQNAFPGITTRLLAHKAKYVMLAVEQAKKFFDKRCNVVVTGNPIRPDIISSSYIESRKKLNLDDRPVILSFGGSLGARKINEAIIDLLVNTSKTDKYQHIHGYGKYGKWFLTSLKEKGVDVKKHPNFYIREYIDDMPTCLAAADLVICRSGAITLSELQAQGKASILIPSPNVAENHQYHNAMALVNNNAASIIEEKNLDKNTLINKVNKLLSDKKLLAEYKENSRKMAICNANEKIFSIIKEVINKF